MVQKDSKYYACQNGDQCTALWCFSNFSKWQQTLLCQWTFKILQILPVFINVCILSINGSLSKGPMLYVICHWSLWTVNTKCTLQIKLAQFKLQTEIIIHYSPYRQPINHSSIRQKFVSTTSVLNNKTHKGCLSQSTNNCVPALKPIQRKPLTTCFYYKHSWSHTFPL